MENSLKILIDSTYLLPAFKIAVYGISEDDLLFLDKLYGSGKIVFYYSNIVWIEILPKVVKEYRKMGLKIDVEDLREIMFTLKDTFNQIDLGPNALIKALELKMLGHNDMIDNLLYGMAWENNMYLLTLDHEFKNFLRKNGLNHKLLITHRDLMV